ncbi:MAG: chemotaxis protein CheA [Chitinivibrionales bacterium]
MSQQDREMLSELVTESREHLSHIEPDLLTLEQNPTEADGELINRIFRAVHSIKGGFGFFGIETITNLSHAMENILSRVREKELEVDSACIDALFMGIDKLRVLLDDIDNATDTDISQELQKLFPFLSENERGRGKEKMQYSWEAVARRHPDITRQAALDAVRDGRHLYEIDLDAVSDCIDQNQTPADYLDSWRRFGEILDIVPPVEEFNRIREDPDAAEKFHLLFATVLEPDLIETGISLDRANIHHIDRTLLGKMQPSEGEKSAQVNKPEKKRKESAGSEESLRVRIGLLNSLMNLAGELVLSRNQMMQQLSNRFGDTPEADIVMRKIMEVLGQGVESDQCQERRDFAQKTIREALQFRFMDIQGLNNIVQDMDRVTSAIQESIMQTRMQPISVVFSKFPRVIRDLSKKLQKDVNLTMVGQDVELDKSIIEVLSDPLTHLIRNCVDHGIESPEKRQRAGKAQQGSVLLRAFHEGGKVNIEIRDDGKGIDAEIVKEKALERGIITEDAAASMSNRELQYLIFAPGFSTAATISDISGRGVGMDVVKTNIERLGGTVELDSEPEKGTRMVLKLPLTLAIIPSLIVTTGGRRFALPQVSLEEIVRIRGQDVTSKIERVQGCEVLRLRGKLLPLVNLEEVLGIEPTFIHPKTGERMIDRRKRWSDRRGVGGGEGSVGEAEYADRRTGKRDRRENVQNAVKVVVLRVENNFYGLVVEDVLDSEEIVVKPLSMYLKGCQAYSGTTIMGDGKIAMILDPNGIANVSELRFNELEKEINEEKKRAQMEDAKVMHNLLLFRTGDEQNFAIHLDSVARIEKRKVGEIENVGNRQFVKYEHSTLQVFNLSDYLPVQPPHVEGENMFIIVPKNVVHPLGILASRVEDIVQTELVLDSKSIRGVGVMGSAIIRKKLTVVIDLKSLLKAVEPELFDESAA